jgi:tRNA G18 (ribose-2'-O)-methylase SpoU
VALDETVDNLIKNKNLQNKLVILWNEVDWVLNSTLDTVDKIVYIPMSWVKESMNVGQSAAIFMWELGK